MKGWDIFIVRVLPFLMFIILGINILCCWLGKDTTGLDMLVGNNAIYALSLYLISKSNPIYHCTYVTADEGMRILGLGSNRAQFFALIKQSGIEANTFNNVKIGYKRNEIIKLRVALSKDKNNFLIKKKRKKYPLSEMLED